MALGGVGWFHYTLFTEVASFTGFLFTLHKLSISVEDLGWRELQLWRASSFLLHPPFLQWHRAVPVGVLTFLLHQRLPLSIEMGR